MAGTTSVSTLRRNPGDGLTVVVNAKEPSLDIVFVHGFTGDSKQTWTYKKATAAPPADHKDVKPSGRLSMKDKLRLRPRPSQDKIIDTPEVYWPTDLLPDTVPTARVMTYGFSAEVRHVFGLAPMSQSTASDIAWNFLVTLEARRRPDPLRPILFIAHSLGGIVVKELLRRSANSRDAHQHLHKIMISTIGILFFGSPTYDADPRRLVEHVIEKSVKLSGISINESVSSSLLPSPERLSELQNGFDQLAQEQDWTIHSFQEQRPSKSISSGKVVEGTSYVNVSSVEAQEHINRNHMDMCRFSGVDDAEYTKVDAAIRRIIDTASKKLTPEAKVERLARLDSLRFDQMDTRQSTIGNAFSGTCQWFLTTPEYLGWLDAPQLQEHGGFLWIKGKTGTGKSTLMKFMLNHIRSNLKEHVVISFFFNARGVELEKSIAGMYRSLLLQLFAQLPKLQILLDSPDLPGKTNSSSVWTAESLKELFKSAVRKIDQTSLVCLIDALDECEEQQIRDMILLIEEVGEAVIPTGIKLKVCFSSRHYPSITIRKGLDLILEGQGGHDEDIARYLDNELKIGHNELSQTIRVELQEKASGVFMWIRMMVGILNKEHDNSQMSALRQRLHDLPGDLHDLYHYLLTRGETQQELSLLCFQWILFAKQPLSVEQLYFAVLSGTEPKASSSWVSDKITPPDMKKFILAPCKGLVEVTKSRIPTVQFIHESVADFLQKENGLQKICPGIENNLTGKSQEALKMGCLRYTNIFYAQQRQLSGSLARLSFYESANLGKSAMESFPLLRYAVENLLYHADASESSGISQKDFIRNFRVPEWVEMNNLFEERKEYRHNPGRVTLLYILALRNLSYLVDIHPAPLSCVEVEDEQYGPPIFAALASGSDDALRAFVFMRDEDLKFDPDEVSCWSPRMPRTIGPDFNFSTRRSVLSYAAEYGDERIFAFLLGPGRLNPDAQDLDHSTSLHWAMKRGHKSIVEILIRHGASIDHADEYGETPLCHGVWNKDLEIVRFLLDQGANVESRDHSGKTQLCRAVLHGHLALVELLISRGADIEAQDREGKTALALAVQSQNEAIITLLLNKNAKTETEDNIGMTPLTWAATKPNGNSAILQSLLRRETGIETRVK